MSVSTIGSNSIWSGPQAAGNASVSGTGSDGDGDGSGAGGAGRISGGQPQGLMQDIMQTFNQLGLATANSAGTGNSGAAATSNNGVHQAMHSFMHSLFQALQQSGASGQSSASGQDSDGDNDGSGGTATASAGGGYGDMVTKLQNLLQSLNGNSTTSSGSGTSQNGALSTLSSSFQNLVQARGTSNNGASENSGVTLKTFLQDMVQNLGNSKSSGMLQPAGNIVRTVA